MDVDQWWLFHCGKVESENTIGGDRLGCAGVSAASMRSSSSLSSLCNSPVMTSAGSTPRSTGGGASVSGLTKAVAVARLVLPILMCASATWSFVAVPHGFPITPPERRKAGAYLVREEAIGGIGRLIDASFDADIVAATRGVAVPRAQALHGTSGLEYAAGVVQVGKGDCWKLLDDARSRQGRSERARVGADRTPLAIAIPSAARAELAKRRAAVRATWAQEAKHAGVPFRFFVIMPREWRPRNARKLESFHKQDGRRDGASSSTVREDENRQIDAPSPGTLLALAQEMQASRDIVLCEDDSLSALTSSYRALATLTLCALQYVAALGSTRFARDNTSACPLGCARWTPQALPE